MKNYLRKVGKWKRSLNGFFKRNKTVSGKMFTFISKRNKCEKYLCVCVYHFILHGSVFFIFYIFIFCLCCGYLICTFAKGKRSINIVVADVCWCIIMFIVLFNNVLNMLLQICVCQGAKTKKKEILLSVMIVVVHTIWCLVMMWNTFYDKYRFLG